MDSRKDRAWVHAAREPVAVLRWVQCFTKIPLQIHVFHFHIQHVVPNLPQAEGQHVCNCLMGLVCWVCMPGCPELWNCFDGPCKIQVRDAIKIQHLPVRLRTGNARGAACLYCKNSTAGCKLAQRSKKFFKSYRDGKVKESPCRYAGNRLPCSTGGSHYTHRSPMYRPK